MDKVFIEQLGHNVEAYVGILVKTLQVVDLALDLEETFVTL